MDGVRDSLASWFFRNTETNDKVLARREEQLTYFFQAAVESKRTQYVYRGTTVPIIPHEYGHPVAQVDCFHAARKLHDHYLTQTQQRREAGRTVY